MNNAQQAAYEYLDMLAARDAGHIAFSALQMAKKIAAKHGVSVEDLAEVSRQIKYSK